MKRRDFLKNSALALGTAPLATNLLTRSLSAATTTKPATASGSASSATAPGGRPWNLLFITVDDMDASMPGWMGNPLKPTPHLDSLAATSHQFVNNRGAAPICQPSREAMMSGRWPQCSGAFGFNPLREGVPTLATALKARGYFLAGFNKLSHMAPPSAFPWDFQNHANDAGRNPATVREDITKGLAAAKASGKPFFINFNINDPHRPFYGADEGGHPARKPEPGKPLCVKREFKPADIPVQDFLEDLPDVRKELSQYYGSVARMDMSIGEILAALKASGEEDRTVIVFCGDHGMSFPFSKVTAYDHGSHTPALLRWPGMGAQQKRDEITSSVDIVPTLLELLGAPPLPGVDGRSWMPLLRGETQPGRDHTFCHVSTPTNSRIYVPQRLVQTHKSALIFAPWARQWAFCREPGKGGAGVDSMRGLTYNAMKDAAKTNPKIAKRIDQYDNGYLLAFYDMEKDPTQRNNVIDDPAYKPEVDRLKKLLLDHLTRTADPELDNYKLALAGGKPDVNRTKTVIADAEAETRSGRGSGKKRKGGGEE